MAETCTHCGWTRIFPDTQAVPCPACPVTLVLTREDATKLAEHEGYLSFVLRSGGTVPANKEESAAALALAHQIQEVLDRGE